MTVQNMLIEAMLASEKQDGSRRGRKRKLRRPAPPGKRLHAPTLVAEWFRKRGNAYFFLFKKNLRVTNLQFPELLALVRRFVKATDGEEIRDLQFIAVEDFNRSVEEIVESFSRDPSNPRTRYEEIAELYISLFRRTCIVTNFFGSCAIFLPPGLDLDLVLVCGLSGYIHSCGRNVYIRSAYKSTKKEFFASLDYHLKCFSTKEHRLFFAPYSHEDFTDFDRDRASELRHGPDDVKIYIEKYYMGSEPMVTILKRMGTHFKSGLVIPEPGDYREMHPKVRSLPGVDKHRTLWLILDHEIRSSVTHPEEKPYFTPSEKVYFICYEQLYLNENPFHIFDENKPAWVSHTTIPHTLAGAMINITMPGWPERTSAVSLGDPFVGTGTTWLESLKDPLISFEGSDLNAIAPLLAQDNLHFFCLDSEELDAIVDRLSSLTKLRRPDPRRPHLPGTPAEVAYTWAEKLFKKLRLSVTTDSFVFTPSEIRQITRNSTPEDRLFFYVGLRAFVRHSSAFRRGSETWEDAYLAELKSIRDQLGQLAKLREAKSARAVGPSKPTLTKSQYSFGCSFGIGLLLRRRGVSGAVPIQIRDARSLPNLKFDVIITDPPYGFNTEGRPEKLARLYANMIPAMIRALKEEGQLVIALPDWSHTGRQVPFFAHKEFVTQQVLVAAEEQGREVFGAAYMAPSPGSMFKPPFYWESDRALRRAILHFRLRKRT
jgi:tRNA G10  N-methylase Trm11